MAHEKVRIQDPNLIPIPNVIIPIQEKITPEEADRVARERKVATSSLYYPPLSAQLPQPFQSVNVVPRLGQKISNISGIEGVDRVNDVSAQAFPKVDVAGSIYDIAAEPVKIAAPNDVDLEELEDTLDELVEVAQELAEENPEAVREVLEKAASEPTPFPNLAREIMSLGISMEGFQTSKLAAYKKEGDKHKEKINLLLSLSSHLPKLSAEDAPSEAIKQETMDKILEIHEKLKAEGIDIFPGVTLGSEISKEHLAAANSLINHHIDVCRTSLQELFTTKISVVIQFLSMMNEVMKKIAEKDDQAKRRANQLPSH